MDTAKNLTGATLHVKSPDSNKLLHYPKGAVVCDEIRISALTKMMYISKEKQKEEEMARDLKECDLDSTTKSVPRRISVEPQVNETSTLETDHVQAASHRLQLHLMEEQRQCEVQAAVSERVARQKEYWLKIEAKLIAEAEARKRQKQLELERESAEIVEFESIEKNRTNLVLQLQNKKHEAQAKKIEKIIEDAGHTDQLKRDEFKHKRELLEKIILKQQRFKDIFTQISEMLKSFPYREEMVAAVTPAVSTIKSLSDMMDTLVKQFKVGEVTQLDLTTAENLVDKLESGYNSVKNKLDEITRQKEEEKKQQETKPEEIPVVVQTIPAAVSPVVSVPAVTVPQVPISTSTSQPSGGDIPVLHVTGLEGFISRENLIELTKHQGILENHLVALHPLQNDDNQKKFRFQCQKAVNTPLNAISAVSSSHLRDKLKRLQNLLRGQPVEVSGSRVAASTHELGVPFCTNLLAERIVEQGGQVVASKPESAFPIAAVALSLMSEFPGFSDFLLAHFYSQCPYLVPYYAPRTADMTDQQYYTVQGYQYTSEGQVEPQDKYLKRMTGIATLYFAIMTSKLPRDLNNLSPPSTLSRVWCWLASLLNLDPRTDVSATMLLVCLQICGSALSATYTKQFNKLFHAIVKLYFPLMQQLSPSAVSGPISRLENFLTECVKKSSIPQPSGMLHPNFW